MGVQDGDRRRCVLTPMKEIRPQSRRITRKIVKWSSLLMLLFWAIVLLFAIMMRGMVHNGSPPTIGSTVIGFSPAPLFFAYMFWLTASRHCPKLRVRMGFVAVGWLLTPIALQVPFPVSTEFLIAAAMFTPFIFYWIWVAFVVRRRLSTASYRTPPSFVGTPSL